MRMINNFLEGIIYHIKGLSFAMKRSKLLFLGILRFFILIAFTIALSTIIISYHDKLMGIVWSKPESIWIVWIWHFVSWIMTMVLVGIATILSYLISQIFFSIFIMDYMSKITEQILTGKLEEPKKISFFRHIIYLIKQEIPRTILPVLILLFLLIIGWITPFGPIFAIISSALTIVFLAWDNTDLVPTRRFLPFKDRFFLMLRNLPFHIGFGLFFLVPIFNTVFFSFAPVGATIYYLDVLSKK